MFMSHCRGPPSSWVQDLLMDFNSSALWCILMLMAFLEQKRVESSSKILTQYWNILLGHFDCGLWSNQNAKVININSLPSTGVKLCSVSNRSCEFSFYRSLELLAVTVLQCYSVTGGVESWQSWWSAIVHGAIVHGASTRCTLERVIIRQFFLKA